MKFKFTVGDWLMVIAGAVMALHPLLFDWAKIAAPGDPRDGVSGYHPFSYVTTGGIAWILVVAVGIAAALIGLDLVKRDSAPWPVILIAASAVGAILMAIRVIAGAGEESDTGIDLDPDAGMYVALVAAALALAGAALGYALGGSSTAGGAAPAGRDESPLPPPGS